MTPEFFNSLFSWTFNEAIDGPEQCNIPFQLQLLFARMQLGLAAVVDTRALTTSFGWVGTDAVLHSLFIYFF